MGNYDREKGWFADPDLWPNPRKPVQEENKIYKVLKPRITEAMYGKGKKKGINTKLIDLTNKGSEKLHKSKKVPKVLKGAGIFLIQKASNKVFTDLEKLLIR